MKKVRKAVIPAAGRGLRFLPATKAQPKDYYIKSLDYDFKGMILDVVVE
jgi:UTP-glucose-1-phosphate uridylyltransferase